MATEFDEFDWDPLLDRIDNGDVLPLVGPALATIPVDGDEVPVLRALAAPLASALHLDDGPPTTTVMEVAREHVRRGRRRDELHAAMRTLLKRHARPSPALAALASIIPFKIFITGTPDSLMAQAVADASCAGTLPITRRERSRRYQPRASATTSPENSTGQPIRLGADAYRARRCVMH